MVPGPRLVRRGLSVGVVFANLHLGGRGPHLVGGLRACRLDILRGILRNGDPLGVAGREWQSSRARATPGR